ncbi:MAG: SRPBCC family protein [Alphaproteobacteria bacterium]|nr:SRPBCC family protein [Alphaproteobacteria bacterium]
MHTLRIETRIAAPCQTCFDLALDMDFHVQTLRDTGERIVGGCATGRIGPGETVTFEGVHFGVRQRFTARITAYEAPTWFRDEMVQGAFTSFAHDHRFRPTEGGCVMEDEVRFVAPFGVLGRWVGQHVLRPHLERLLRSRCEAIAREAERRTRLASVRCEDTGRTPVPTRP